MPPLVAAQVPSVSVDLRHRGRGARHVGRLGGDDRGRGIHHHHELLRLGRDVARRQRVRRQHEAREDVDIVAHDQLLREALGDVRRDAAGVLADEFDLAARDGVAVLLHVELDGVVHLRRRCRRTGPEYGMIRPILIGGCCAPAGAAASMTAASAAKPEQRFFQHRLPPSPVREHTPARLRFCCSNPSHECARGRILSRRGGRVACWAATHGSRLAACLSGARDRPDPSMRSSARATGHARLDHTPALAPAPRAIRRSRARFGLQAAGEVARLRMASAPCSTVLQGVTPAWRTIVVFM